MTDDSTWSIGPSEEDVIADLIRRNVFTPSADGANRMAAMIDDRAYTIAVPAGHFAIVLPITDSATKLIGDSRIARDLTDRVYALPNG